MALDRFSERAHRAGDARALRSRAPARGSAAGTARCVRCSTRSSASSRTPETRALEAAILRQEDVRSLLPRPITRAAGGTAGTSRRLIGRTQELELLERVAREALDGLVRPPPDRGGGRTREDAPARRAVATLFEDAHVGRAECSRARAAPSLRAARGRAPRRSPASSSTANGCRRSHGSCPSSLSIRSAREFSEIEVLEALVAVVAAQAPLVLLLDDLHAGRPGDDRRARLPAAAPRRDSRRDRRHDRSVHAARRPPAPPLAPDAVVRLGPLTPTSSRRSGFPSLHESTGGNPRFVTRCAGGRPAPRAPRARSRRRCSPSAAPRASGLPHPPHRLAARAAVRAGAARGHARQEMPPSSPRSSSGSASGESSASTGSASASATTSSASGSLPQPLTRAQAASCGSGSRRRTVGWSRHSSPSSSRRRRGTHEGERRASVRRSLRAGATSRPTSWIRRGSHPRRERRPAARSSAYTREELLETPISRIHPGRAARAERVARRVLRDGAGIDDQAHLQDEAGDIPPDRDLAPRARDRTGDVRILGTRPGPQRAPPARARPTEPATQLPHRCSRHARCNCQRERRRKP